MPRRSAKVKEKRSKNRRRKGQGMDGGGRGGRDPDTEEREWDNAGTATATRAGTRWTRASTATSSCCLSCNCSSVAAPSRRRWPMSALAPWSAVDAVGDLFSVDPGIRTIFPNCSAVFEAVTFMDRNLRLVTSHTFPSASTFHASLSVPPMFPLTPILSPSPLTDPSCPSPTDHLHLFLRQPRTMVPAVCSCRPPRWPTGLCRHQPRVGQRCCRG